MLEKICCGDASLAPLARLELLDARRVDVIGSSCIESATHLELVGLFVLGEVQHCPQRKNGVR